MTTFHTSFAPRLVCFVAGAAATAAIVMLAGAGNGSQAVPTSGPVDQEPVLFVDVAGFGIGGPLHSRLAVYSDGTVMVADSTFVDNGSACFMAIDPAVVRALREDLRTAGAPSLSDLPLVGDDIPVTTATVFTPTGNGNSRARTFSYTVATTPQMAEFESIVQAFRETNVAPAACGPDGD